MLKLMITAAMTMIVVLASGLLTQSSYAHVEHGGEGGTIAWYPRECCGNGDCKPVTEIERVGAGVWLKTADGPPVFVGMNEARQPSPDLKWHICLRYDHEVEGLVLHCVFEPGGRV